MADLYSTDTLNAVVADMRRTPAFFVNTYFPMVQQDQTEEIHFDSQNSPRRIAPFVSPLVAGKIVESQGYKTSTFKPAYVKDKRVFDPNRPLKRSMGEQIGGSLTPMERVMALLAQDTDDQIQMVDRRLELMASEILQTGAVTITGENYPTQVVDFQRDPSLTIVLTQGVDTWEVATVNPLDDLQDWSQLVLKLTGTRPAVVSMDVDTWKIFREKQTVKDRLDITRLTSMMQLDAAMEQGGVYMGDVDAFQIYVYSDWYVDDAGVEQPMLPSGTVIMGGSGIEGYQAYGAIRDERAGYQALQFFQKSWLEQDPAVRYLMLQSAPLIVPYRVNASLAATVL